MKNLQPAEPPRRLYSVPEVARMWSVTPKHVWALTYSGQLASVKLGRRRLIPAEEVDRFEASLRENQV